MKYLPLLILMGFLFPARSAASTHTAASCSQASFAAAFASASDGDTIVGPAGGGSATWSSPVVSAVTTALINGNGCAITVNGSDVFDLTWTNSAYIPRITNFTLNGYSGGAMFSIGGNVPQFRVDHIVVNAVPHGGNPYFIWFGHQSFVNYYKQLYGLIDHITYTCTSNGTCDAFLFYGVDWSWLNPHTMGSAQAIYVEDSSFTCPSCVGYQFGTVTDAQHGAKFVIRHTTLQNMAISEHDVGVALDRGTRQYEAYDNTMTCRGTAQYNCFDAIAMRGGTNMIYSNSIAIDPSGVTGWQVYGFH